jgi:signal recognition particle subunit SEC65
MPRSIILWLAYFDCSLKRRLGRRVSLDICVNNPKPEEFLEVCKKLGLECEYIDKRYPKTWYKPLGSLLIKNTEFNKSKLMNIVAKEVKNLKQK